MIRLVQRRQRNELLDHISIDADRASIAHSAVHDAVPGRNQFPVRKARFEPSQKRCDDIFMRRGFRQLLVDQPVSGAMLRGETNPVSQSFVGAFANEIAPCRPPVSGKQRELDAR